MRTLPMTCVLLAACGGPRLPEVESVGQNAYVVTARGEHAASRAHRVAEGYCLDRLQGIQVADVSMQTAGAALRFSCGGPMAFSDEFAPIDLETWTEGSHLFGYYTSHAADAATARAASIAYAHAYCARHGRVGITTNVPQRFDEGFRVGFTCP